MLSVATRVRPESACVPAASVWHTFMQYLIAFCNISEATSDIMSDRFVRLAILDKCVKFRDPRVNRSPEILLEAVEGGIFDRFSNVHK